MLVRLFFLALFFTCALLQSNYVTFSRDDTTILLNPERGFYSEVETQSVLESPQPLADSDMSDLLSQNIVLIQRSWYMKALRNTSSLPTSQLQLVAKDFAMIRKYNFKIIPRFTYSQDPTEPDASMAIIQSHLSQLTPILQNNSDIIAVFQAGFIGSYGEWYYSSNNINNIGNYTLLINSLLSILPQDRVIQIRVPQYKQQIYNSITSPYNVNSPATGIRSSNYSRIGIHDDCFLADAYDQGTFNIDTDRQWLANESLRIPFGGESCATSSYSVCGNAKIDLAKFHMSFVNIAYFPGVISSWKSGGCFNEFANKLGYRLSLISASTNINGNQVSYSIAFNNSGYAAPYNAYQIHLGLVNSAGVVYNLPLSHDVRYWTPEVSPIVISSTVSLSSNVPFDSYRMLIKVCDPLLSSASYCIKLANTDTSYNATTGYHSLKSSILYNSTTLQTQVATPTVAQSSTTSPSINSASTLLAKTSMIVAVLSSILLCM
ncbi:AFC3 [Acrasis kona]|uniref:AFC3 n=1 Tax=Acrasis kona TaxID=1008807 RepID=A0AAW2YI66_9EUKA